MKISGTLIFLFLSVFLSAQEKWPTANGDLIINPIQHASMVWEWNGLTIYIDPVGDSSSYSSFSEPDLIFITHSHGDHLSNKTLENIHAKNAIFIVPNEVADKLDVKFKNQLHTMQNGDDLNVLGISIRCVPAYNYPVTSESRHLKGVGNGTSMIIVAGIVSSMPGTFRYLWQLKVTDVEA